MRSAPQAAELYGADGPFLVLALLVERVQVSDSGGVERTPATPLLAAVAARWGGGAS